MNKIMADLLRLSEHTLALLEEYVEWGSKIRVGEVQQGLYNDLIDFANFRLETASTCVQLIEEDRIAEVLGLCRSLLENYLLYILMCRGSKFFRLQDRIDLTDSEFKKYLLEKQEELASGRGIGATDCIAVQPYRRAKRHVMYVYEGLKSRDDDSFVVPIHYFQFREFRPEVMRLKRGDYFEYVDFDPSTLRAIKGHQQQAAVTYRHYLSYDALLTCLELNGLAAAAALARIEAHYTFLGRFLHPTHDAARSLHVDSNFYAGRPRIGMSSPYSQEARLLAALYVCYLAAGFLDEIAHAHENAPNLYIAEPGTRRLRDLTAEVPRRYSYFWFLFNDAPMYDKFLHCSARATDEELKSYGHYSNTPTEHIRFNQHILSHLAESLGACSNGRAGYYSPPLGG